MELGGRFTLLSTVYPNFLIWLYHRDQSFPDWCAGACACCRHLLHQSALLSAKVSLVTLVPENVRTSIVSSEAGMTRGPVKEKQPLKAACLMDVSALLSAFTSRVFHSTGADYPE